MAAVAIIPDNCFAFKLILNELFYLCQIYIIMYNSDVMKTACFLSNYNENSFSSAVIVFTARCPPNFNLEVCITQENRTAQIPVP